MGDHCLESGWTTQVNPALAMFGCCPTDMMAGLQFAVDYNGQGPGTSGASVVYMPCATSLNAGSTMDLQMLSPFSTMTGGSTITAANS